jgi:hypothetical protein
VSQAHHGSPENEQPGTEARTANVRGCLLATVLFLIGTAAALFSTVLPWYGWGGIPTTVLFLACVALTVCSVGAARRAAAGRPATRWFAAYLAFCGAIVAIAAVTALSR